MGPQATLLLSPPQLYITSFRSKSRICSPKGQTETDEQTLNDEIIGICFNEVKKRSRCVVLFSRTVDLKMMKLIFLNGCIQVFFPLMNDEINIRS